MASSQQHDARRFQSELNGSVDKVQTIIHHLGTVKDDVDHLQNEIDQHQSNVPAIYQMSTICARCTRDTINALSGADAMRSKYQQLNNLFSNPQTSSNEARSLTLEIQRLSGSFFSTISSIKQSLDDIEIHARNLQKPRKEPWWKKILNWIRDGLAILAAVTAFIPKLNVITTAALALAASLAGLANTYAERRLSRPMYPRLQAAVEQTVATRETLDSVLTYQPVLDHTTGQALSILDGYDMMQRMLSGQQTNTYQ